ncbi:MAG: nucleotidyltransferase family protein [Deltaproteobacteria bacterium]|nr:nucleotidyltransferase family protein [Deltaproteobacteria bacterium]
MQSREQVLAVLRDALPRLRPFGVRSLALFGSFARDEADARSDVDVLVEFASTPRFGEWLDVRDQLAVALGRPVDLVMTTALQPRMKAEVASELLRVA